MSKSVFKISARTIGCRLNQYETEKIATSLIPYGFVRVGKNESADIFVINTCTVTHRADADARNIIRRAARLNPEGKIVVTGCYAGSHADELAQMSDVDLVVTNRDKDKMLSILQSRFPEMFKSEPISNCSENISDFYLHNRAWLKVSDGCNQWCSFCIIPQVRGRLKNRSALEIINEINSLVESGYEEVVLTGVNLGHYKNRKVEPQIKNLASLCRMILEKTHLHRLRISSIEPQTVRQEMLDVYAQSGGRICRHFHMPLQSGSSKILKEMQRPYDQKIYLKRVEAVKEVNPDTTIGADVIVGFPGETDEDFRETKKVVESGLLDYLHVFSYSDRPNTKASSYDNKTEPKIIRERNQELTEISKKIKENSYIKQLGKNLEIISESTKASNGHFWGISDNFLKVKVSGKLPENSRKAVKVNIIDYAENHLSGTLISE